jgi:putative oxidoreductase
MIRRIIKTDNAKTTILIRLMVGCVFLSEGLQKFLFADKLGSGRFAKIGLPHPDILGPIVGAFEIVCGIMVLMGLFTRLAALPVLVIILAAISLTKSQLFIHDGFWSMLHDSRTDWSMLLGSTFLFIKGGGKWSLDNALWKE